GGKLSYPRWNDLSSALGPERTVTQVGNPANVYRTGDSLEIEFADPSQVTNVSNWNEVWAQDGGKDLNFQRVFLPVGSAYKTSDFRFRVRLKAKNDFEPGNPTDDADAWYLDNFSVRDESQPELEASFIRFNSSWSYTSVPSSQATYVPIEAEVANNGGKVAQSFGLNVLVYPNPIRARYYDSVTHQSIPIPDYSNLITIPVLEAGQKLLVNSGRWNARQSGPGQFNLVARIQPKGYDAEPENDSTYTTVTMSFGNSYAYDQGTNDIPGFFGVSGLGLNLPASTTDPTSDPGGTSGTVAVKFKVYNSDTIFGVNIFFGYSNPNNDSIRVMLYRSNDSVPGNKLQNGCLPLYATRQAPWDDFSTYLFSCGPVFLQPGDYWIGVTQVSTAGYEIGGNASRSSMDWIGYDPSNQQNIFAMNYPEVEGLFAYENIAGSGVWHPFEYPVGSGVAAPAYGSPQSEMAYSIKSSNCNKTYNYFIGQGSWIPMIRPYFKARPYVWLPIDITSFSGEYVPNYIALAWKTASEVNNIGYYVERRGVSDAAWSTLNASLIPGNGTTTQPYSYSYDDRNIAMGTTYQYRLRQVDNNGDVHYSNTVEITTPFADYDLAQNYPNPFKSSTQISYTLPSSGSVTLKVYDMLGREVRSLVEEYEQSREYSVTWDGKDNGGAEVPSGAYLYKMTVNGHTFSKTLSLVR
ncbi:MAG TPA: FlgD immunoglobulin-like domain containing protein, partial [Candidatus Kapabacteria bacterium]|nr:FlgD immunoglobulin-like domain containing protein [Candidatus Kapabacteria bacterium]